MFYPEENLDSRENFYLTESQLEWISLKKSEYLSLLIENLTTGDYSFEDYYHFDTFLTKTLEFPDQVYEDEVDSHRLRTYQRFYSDPKIFYQIVIGVVFRSQNNDEVFVPILSFVTKEPKIREVFSLGNLVKSTIRH
jgi:hypothetical protein